MNPCAYGTVCISEVASNNGDMPFLELGSMEKLMTWKQTLVTFLWYLWIVGFFNNSRDYKNIIYIDYKDIIVYNSWIFCSDIIDELTEQEVTVHDKQPSTRSKFCHLLEIYTCKVATFHWK